MRSDDADELARALKRERLRAIAAAFLAPSPGAGARRFEDELRRFGLKMRWDAPSKAPAPTDEDVRYGLSPGVNPEEDIFGSEDGSSSR